ncbi:MAG: N-formylglutamate amidohydrolase [Bacteroidetes bacterium]|nr:N-formylglutamate amidohydrolase [Bacteroidota bacterium]
MEKNKFWEVIKRDGPLVATAIHDGHDLREEIKSIIALSDSDQLREEDPFTSNWTTVGNTQINVNRSRFEVDLNRPREKAVYIAPEDAWGLRVWKSELSQEIIDRSLEEYDSFYSEVHKIFEEIKNQYGKFVVFDLHTYCYLREGPDGKPADPKKNPEVNIGTGTMNREYWAPLVDRFINDLRNYNFKGRKLDVRENVKFKGGQFARWTHETFPDSACSLSIEFKKFFMDEWTGKPDNQMLDEISLALQSTIPGVLEELKKLGLS